ncbi:hypothetical protein FS749_010474 [Ceratobasidium sp. UAMH 11750]|nr:hypothetical protein FS749_010474 [Ceratobasidium sp. UAMH 11750]
MVRGKQRNARWEIMNTRAQAAISRVTQRIDMAVWEYQNSRNALHSLGLLAEDCSLFQPLSQADVTKLSKFVSIDRNVGEGYKQAPWLWLLSGTEQSRASDSNKAIEAEIDEANRVEWFRGCERYKRWQEEVAWLQREVASVILDFDSRAQEWNRLANSNHAGTNGGYKSYCIRQRDAWTSMCTDTYSRATHILRSASNVDLCVHVLQMFGPNG